MLEPWLTSEDLLARPYSSGLTNSYCYFDRNYDPVGGLGDRSEGQETSIIVSFADAVGIGQGFVVTVHGEGTFLVVDRQPQGDGKYWKLTVVQQ